MGNIKTGGHRATSRRMPCFGGNLTTPLTRQPGNWQRPTTRGSFQLPEHGKARLSGLRKPSNALTAASCGCSEDTRKSPELHRVGQLRPQGSARSTGSHKPQRGSELSHPEQVDTRTSLSGSTHSLHLAVSPKTIHFFFFGAIRHSTSAVRQLRLVQGGFAGAVLGKPRVLS